MRILPDSSLRGARTLLVDSQGNGDFTTIQAALNHAAQYASPQAPWVVRVAPGVYPENLALKDWVDLYGLGPGSASQVSPSSGSAIVTPATCSVAHLALSSRDAVVALTGPAFIGWLNLLAVTINQSALDIYSLQVEGGRLSLTGCWLAAGGPLYMGSGWLEAYHSVLVNQALEDGGANMALYIRGGTLKLVGCQVENRSPAGYCVYIDQPALSLHANHCLFHCATSTYAIHATLSAGFNLAACAGNAGLHPNLTGFHDYVFNPSL